MDPEESALLRYAAGKVNSAIANGEFTADDDDRVSATLLSAMAEAVSNSTEITPADHKWFQRRIHKRRHSGAAYMGKVRRSLLKRWGRGLRLYDQTLIAAEVLNEALEDCIGAWILSDDCAQPEKLLGVEGAMGGRSLKCILMLSLQSRACSVAHEIRLLAERGFPEGVMARSRSLHEFAVIAAALSSLGLVDTSVSDRYGAWTVAEARKADRVIAGQGGTPEPRGQSGAELETRAEATWGSDFFKQNAWATPLFPNRRPPIPFVDIEKHVGMDHMRSYYLAGNEAIHAGPSALTDRTRFRNGSIFPVSSEVQHETVRHFLAVALISLTDVSIEACKAVASITQDFDLMFAVKVISDASEEAVEEFRQGGMRP
ncbi:DUF5677 domain-containing protein [Streptomyces ficellus]|uniref:Uncharacterized protein n=1 Tax=Streptomyces ficellus TaxID=1977088 RepID=A0A6I6F867_9ACTN|nr:DUF5677 domain-containing protein [Streptomyces ficellus]QGV79900.1 hypothetical protein EIZ62_17905 [Streptomyces ficellus]